MPYLLFNRRVRPADRLAVGQTPVIDTNVVAEPGFAVNQTQWAALSALNTAAANAKAVASGLTAPNLTELQTHWSAMSATFDAWASTQAAMKRLGDDIVSYARTIVPQFYGRIDTLFNAATPDFAAIDELLAVAIEEADKRAATAATLVARIQPTIDAVTDFRHYFANVVRVPQTQIVLSKIGDLCLSYNPNDNGRAVAAHRTDTDIVTWWLVEPAEGRDGWYRFRTPDLQYVLCAPRDADSGDPAPVEVLGVGLPREEPDKEALQACFRLADVYIEPATFPGHTLDCSGNGDWNRGTPILNWEQNGGDNQQWQLTIDRVAADVQLYDAVYWVNDAGRPGLPQLGELANDWGKVSQDLGNLRDAARQVDLSKGSPDDPVFVAMSQIAFDIVESDWVGLANETQAASSGL